MAKKKTKKYKDDAPIDDLEQVDIFYIPKQFAEMYRVLREAVAEDITEWLSNQYPLIERVSDDLEEGEALIAKNVEGKEVFRYYLNPRNISEAQEARDKNQLITYLEYYVERMNYDGENS